MTSITHPFQRRILGLWLVLAMLITSCAPQPTAAAPQTDAPPAATADVPAAAVADEEVPAVEDLEVQFKEGDYQPASFSTQALGSVAFTQDPAAAVEREIFPDDEGVELQVTDSTGLTWTLHIPAGSVIQPVTVRLAPLSELQASFNRPAGQVIGGVSLEPDGLTFRQPLQLSVSGETLQGLTLLLSGTGSGAEIKHTLRDLSANDPTASINHFSTYFASNVPDPEIAEINQEAWEEFNDLAKDAKKLRKAPLEIPVPPSIPLECTDEDTREDNREEIDEFIEDAQEPELELIGEMLTQWRIILLTSEETLQGVPDLAVGMTMRLVRKANVLIDQYHHDETKLLAISEFAIRSARQLALMGGDQAMIQQIIDRMAEWNLSLIDDLVEDIKKNHNYKRIPMAMMVAYHASLLGRADATRDFLDQLREALKFELRYTFTILSPDLKLTQSNEAVIPLQFEPAYGWLYRCYGEGKGQPVKAEMIADPEAGSYDLKTFAYPVKAWLTEFDPCEGTMKIGFDTFGSEKDYIVYTSKDGTFDYPWTLFYDAGESVFAEQKSEEGFYTFELKVNNGQKIAVEETIEPPEHDDFQDTLEIQLIHQ